MNANFLPSSRVFKRRCSPIQFSEFSMKKSPRNILKVAYFDEMSALDYLNVYNGGFKETENNDNVSVSSEAKASSEIGGGTGMLAKCLEPFISLKLSGNLEGSLGRAGESIVRTTISNTVLSDYISSATLDERVSKIAPPNIYALPNSLSSIMMYTPILKLIDFKAQGIEGFNFSLFDETLEKIKGYLELITKHEDGTQEILRFNTQAFRNNYKLADLTKMKLTFFCIQAGQMSLDQLDPKNEFSVAGKEEIVTASDLLNDAKSTAKELLPFYDVVLAGIITDE